MKTRPDCVFRSAADFRLLVTKEHETTIRRAGLVDARGYEGLLVSLPGVQGGRGSNRILAGPPEGSSIRIRPLRRGGILGPWLGDRFLRPGRPFREFERWAALRDRGAPLPRPIFAVSGRKGLFWRSAFGAIEYPSAMDAGRWLESGPDRARLHAGCRAFARALRCFHDAGGLHGDLHLGNILIENGPRPEATRCWLIDLDDTRLLGSLSPRHRAKDLVRLFRSCEKAGRDGDLSPRILALTLSAYCGRDRALRARLLRSISIGFRRLRRHRLAWWIGRRLSATVLALAVLLAVGCRKPDEEGIGPAPEAIRWSLLATGDTGRTSPLPDLFEGQRVVARAMTAEAKRIPVSGIVLLGDNFYWHGLDRAHLVERLKQNLVRPYCHFLALDGPRSNEIREACPLPGSARDPVPLFAVLGNHDLETPESVSLERETIPEFLPGWKMSRGLAEAVEIGPGISLVLFESEIAIDDREAIAAALQDAIAKAEGPWIILATHRPIATDDLGNPPRGGYPEFVSDAIAGSGRAVQLVLAGHHHNLQVFEVGSPTPSLQIGIGSGSRALPPLARNHPQARFGAIELGFARIDLVGEGDDERLAVSVFQTGRWPGLAWLQPTRLRARFDVDRQGRVIDRSIGPE